MINETDKENEDVNINDIYLATYYKFQLLKKLNTNIVKFLDKCEIKELSMDVLEETEYYFDQLIHEYSEIKPVMNELRKLHFSKILKK